MAKKTTASLTSALSLILVCATLCVIVTVIAGIVTGEWLYYVAAVLFAFSGGAGLYVVKALSAKIKK
ncbi:MAG: hypothetical protein J5I53_06040 [Bradyrhizobiaceae bacterium]|nr:hypothetical protein [Bradyrhizobiaceae bacterium]